MKNKENKVLNVLLVEDDKSLQRSICRLIRSSIDCPVIIFTAGTVLEAELIFDGHNQEIDVILLDTHLEKNTTTFDFAKRICKVFKKPIISISSCEESRERMRQFGCTHDCRKSDVVILLKKIFHF